MARPTDSATRCLPGSLMKLACSNNLCTSYMQYSPPVVLICPHCLTETVQASGIWVLASVFKENRPRSHHSECRVCCTPPATTFGEYCDIVAHRCFSKHVVYVMFVSVSSFDTALVCVCDNRQVRQCTGQCETASNEAPFMLPKYQSLATPVI